MKEKDLDKTTLRLMMMVAMLFVTAVSTAQSPLNKRHYQVDYVNESHLLRKGRTINVVHVNFEWPRFLSDNPTNALQKSLCKIFFNNGHNNLEKGLNYYLKKCGNEIHQMPDEEGLETNYINLELQTLAWERDKYISLRVIRSYRSGDEDTPFFLNELLTYDVVADKVLRLDDIFKWSKWDNFDIRDLIAGNTLQSIVNDSYELGNLFQSVLTDSYDFYAGDYPNQACLVPNGVLLSFPGTANDDGVENTSIVPLNCLNSWLTLAAKKTLKGSGKRRKDNTKRTDPVEHDNFTMDTTLVYDFAPTMPKYKGEERDMLNFIHRHATYPAYEKLKGIQGKVLVSFIVERDGSLSAPSVISPVSPGIDRQAVKAVMSMPGWKPGMKDGVPVRVRMTVPVVFKMADGEGCT
ncbi:MAG: energy transducer TonB [Prevotella sp.]|nr:energy transducer TonB [Prevotella sp.]